MNIKKESHTLREWQKILANNPELMAEFEEMTSPTPIKGDISEQPVEGLEEAAEEHTFFAANQPGQDWETHDVTDAFKAGAEWMKAKMLEDAVEGIAHPNDCEIWVNLVGYGYKFKDGDKVRVIVIKEYEK